MKKLKEEEATVEKVLALLQGGGDVRKGDLSPKEVGGLDYVRFSILT